MKASSDNQAEQSENQASANDAEFSKPIPAWEQLINAYKMQILKATELVSSELALSLKAITFCWLSILVMLGLSALIWITLCASFAYWIYTITGYWIVMPIVVITLNGIGVWFALQIYKKCKPAIGLPNSKKALF
ncbi:DUF2244 domain-containing protein [Paraglaciecola aquimarina]|uniref:DUF2244 domain-containing protein n=1 Tax=Paraglaciecola algarum TaxID=3050085 RepID=A0ABS9D4H9_9ALTE|nr:DUF2244 domain-containing protein [Paraglaciecola sp. G1-23]MCF2947848.1 DUF2244 domain-containing protein [Paraglaciecola sp. G1-23]